MRGIDTNILLRTVDLANPLQSAAVEALLDQAVNEPLFVNHIVLSEFAWTLERSYKRPRAEIALRLRHILEAPDFVVPDADIVQRAIEVFERSKAQFPDCLIGATNLACGCDTTLSFDKEAIAVSSLFSPLPT